MKLTLIGVNHRTAPVELRERLHWSESEVPTVLSRVLAPGAAGVVLLSTCNRIEFCLMRPTGAAVAEVWRAAEERLGESVEGYAYLFDDRIAVHHVFRVAAGLDSMVLGESQIQGQVRQAWEAARGHAGPELTRLYQMALSVGGRVRSETQLGRGAASVPSASVDLAKKIFGSLTGRRALILGAGEMAELAMGCLTAEGVQTALVAHRNLARAQELALRLGGHAIGYDDAWPLFADVDIVLASTAAPHPVVVPERIAEPVARRQGRPLCLLDIAVPRDVDPAVDALDNVFRYDIDDLEGVVAANVGARRREVPAAEAIVKREVDFFWEWLEGRGVVHVIRALRAKAEALRDAEVERALAKLEHLEPADRKHVAYLARALTNKLLHEPTIRLRRAAGNGREAQVADVLRYLFDLDVSQGEAPDEGEDGT